MADKILKSEVLSEEQLDEVNGGLIAKEIINGVLNEVKGVLTTIDSDEYKMLSDKQKNIAFMMAIEGIGFGVIGSIPGIGSAIGAVNSAAKDMSPEVRTTAEQAMDVIVKLVDKYNSENPF